MSKEYGVYTKVTRLCNRFQIVWVVSWTILGLCAIIAKTGHIHLRGAHHLLLPTLCVGLHPMVQENHHRAQLYQLVSIPSQIQNSQVLTSPTHCLKPFSPGRKYWACVWWDGVLISSLVSAAFRSLQQLSRDFMQVWIVMRKEATYVTDFATSLLSSAFTATSENTKDCFL